MIHSVDSIRKAQNTLKSAVLFIHMDVESESTTIKGGGRIRNANPIHLLKYSG